MTFGPVTDIDRKNAMHVSPPCKCTGGLKNKPNWPAAPYFADSDNLFTYLLQKRVRPNVINPGKVQHLINVNIISKAWIL